MAFSKTAVILFTIYIFYFTSVGSTPVRNLLDFKYQALVQGIENESYECTLMGGAAIIAERFALSAAYIFLQQNEELKERRFYIGMGTRDLGTLGGWRLTVKRIFAPVFDPTFTYFNLVVVEVEGSFNFEQASTMAPARLPNVTDNFENLEAIASGFGLFEVNTENGALFNSVKSGRISSTLRYAKVAILDENACQKWYPANMTVMNMCGTIDSVYPVPLTGICYGDIGGPLVIDTDLLIGIVSSTTHNCDNTRIGALYIKVAPYVNEIKNFMNKVIPPHAFVRYNRKYISCVISY